MQATRPQETSTPTQTTTEAPPSPSTSTPTAVLRIRGRALHSAKVAWTEEVVDNEFMGKKKSKSPSPLHPQTATDDRADPPRPSPVCCIYHKPRPFDESSGEESDSSCGSAGSNDSRRAHSHSHPNGPTGPSGGEGEQAREGGSSTVVEEPVVGKEPNAYEKGGGKGKGE